jgi:hypothetical protein
MFDGIVIAPVVVIVCCKVTFGGIELKSVVGALSPALAAGNCEKPIMLSPLR